MPKREKQVSPVETNSNVVSIDKGWQRDFRCNNSQQPESKSPANIKLILEHDPLLKNKIVRNDFTGMIETAEIQDLKIKAGEWNDDDDSSLRVYIDKEYLYTPTKDALFDGITSYSLDHSYNPVKERIEKVSWDSKPRLETFFCDYLGAENSEYVRAVTRVWFTGMIARVYQPAIKFELVPILAGKQGIGKSSLVGSIFPEYFLDNLDTLGKTKDDLLKLSGKWIVELGELSAMKKTDVEQTKSFISEQQDNYRSPYGRRSVNHPRKCVFIGTSNPKQFLKDKTGNRRFAPIEVNVQPKVKDPTNVNDDDMLQILAEAKHLYDSGAKLYLSPEIEQQAKLHQDEALVDDPELNAIKDYLTMPVTKDWGSYTLSEKSFLYDSYFRYFENGGKTKDGEIIVASKQGIQEIYSSKTWNPVTALKGDEYYINAVSTKELLIVVFHYSSHEIATIGRSGLTRRINLIFDGFEDWKKARYRFNNSPSPEMGFKKVCIVN